MNQKEQDKTLDQIDIVCNHYRSTKSVNQIIGKAIEELGELQASLGRHLTGQSVISEISDETADVTLMLCQLTDIIGQTQYEASLQKKLAREELRIKNLKRTGSNQFREFEDRLY